MCQFASFIVVKNGDILYDALLDSHSDIVALFKLPDTTAHHQHFAKVELTPPDDWQQWTDVSLWRFRLDEDTVPGWWSDVAVTAEASCRAIIQRAILPTGEHQFHLSGLAIVGPGVTLRDVRGGRVVVCGGTLSNFRGGTLSDFCGGTLSDFRGGTLSDFRGGTLSDFRGGTLSNFRGGTLSDFWGGTLSNFRGGTLSDFRGGTLSDFRGGTLSDFRGGTLSDFRGGTLSNFRGGTLSDFWGGTLSNFRGGTLSDFRGGTLSDFRGGTLSDFRGGTLSNFRGGTLSAIHDDYNPTILAVAKGAKLNAAFRKFIATKPKAARKAAKRKDT